MLCLLGDRDAYMMIWVVFWEELYKIDVNEISPTKKAEIISQ